MRPVRHSSLIVLAVALAVAVLSARSADAYTIYLKDGSRLVAAEKYKIKGDKALITLQNGTVTTIKASEIDVARSDQANTGNYGTAVVLEGSKVADTPAPPPAAAPGLSDLIASRAVGPRDLPEVKRAAPPQAVEVAAGKTAGGFADFTTLPHNPLALEVSSEIQKSFFEHGLREISIWRGTKPDRALVEVSVTSEATAFKALAVAAKVLDEFRTKHPGTISGIELSLTSSQNGRAGQFLMTPEQAADLLANKVEITAYYVDNLQF
ncbi:MAG: hypothetical protein ABI609_11415 [Acidobacteriota bacterium]